MLQPNWDKIKKKILSLPKTITEDGCWLFLGKLHKNGYAKVNWKNIKTRSLIRIVGYVWHGLDLEDLSQEACHKLECKNKHCFYFGHIYIGSHKDNMRDMQILGTHGSSKKTHCPRGHDYSIYGSVYSGRRYCRQCNAEKKKEARLRKSNKKVEV